MARREEVVTGWAEAGEEMKAEGRQWVAAMECKMAGVEAKVEDWADWEEEVAAAAAAAPSPKPSR